MPQRFVLPLRSTNGNFKVYNILKQTMSQLSPENIEKLLNDPSRNYNFDQLRAKIKEPKVYFVDVREPQELQETGSIPGSINIPLGEIESALGTLSETNFKEKYHFDKPVKESLVIFSCRSGKRSLQAMIKALNLGYTNAANYKGGWLDWAENTKNN